MDKQNRTRRVLAGGAVVLSLVAGSYGIAAAASGNGSSSTDGTTTQPAPTTPDPQNPWGAQRSDETPLTGDTLAKSRRPRSQRSRTRRSFASRPTRTATPPTRRTSSRRTERLRPSTSTRSSTWSAWRAAEARWGSPRRPRRALPHSMRAMRPSSTETAESRAFGSTGPVRRCVAMSTPSAWACTARIGPP